MLYRYVLYNQMFLTFSLLMWIWYCLLWKWYCPRTSLAKSTASFIKEVTSRLNPMGVRSLGKHKTHLTVVFIWQWYMRIQVFHVMCATFCHPDTNQCTKNHLTLSNKQSTFRLTLHSARSLCWQNTDPRRPPNCTRAAPTVRMSVEQLTPMSNKVLSTFWHFNKNLSEIETVSTAVLSFF